MPKCFPVHGPLRIFWHLIKFFTQFYLDYPFVITSDKHTPLAIFLCFVTVYLYSSFALCWVILTFSSPFHWTGCTDCFKYFELCHVYGCNRTHDDSQRIKSWSAIHCSFFFEKVGLAAKMNDSGIYLHFSLNQGTLPTLPSGSYLQAVLEHMNWMAFRWNKARRCTLWKCTSDPQILRRILSVREIQVDLVEITLLWDVSEPWYHLFCCTYTLFLDSIVGTVDIAKGSWSAETVFSIATFCSSLTAVLSWNIEVYTFSCSRFRYWLLCPLFENELVLFWAGL